MQGDFNMTHDARFKDQLERRQLHIPAWAMTAGSTYTLRVWVYPLVPDTPSLRSSATVEIAVATKGIVAKLGAERMSIGADQVWWQ